MPENRSLSAFATPALADARSRETARAPRAIHRLASHHVNKQRQADGRGRPSPNFLPVPNAVPSPRCARSRPPTHDRKPGSADIPEVLPSFPLPSVIHETGSVCHGTPTTPSIGGGSPVTSLHGRLSRPQPLAPRVPTAQTPVSRLRFWNTCWEGANLLERDEAPLSARLSEPCRTAQVGDECHQFGDDSPSNRPTEGSEARPPGQPSGRPAAGSSYPFVQGDLGEGAGALVQVQAELLQAQLLLQEVAQVPLQEVPAGPLLDGL